ncbi:uncharacterized protein JN550_001400 [Neoarthrinium moseri]|uniref:uncharacterized protein n=1 Tax=Neoarthrinium moseri TaxID=1658444 RepID=UPI001FDE9AD9|nr:uncharacterized protein JN550_001400 [Neoarthrinium moseri]KAI1875904.1 hypothetical protein JN550_001400 [Neoarthrinium moseri]
MAEETPQRPLVPSDWSVTQETQESQATKNRQASELRTSISEVVDVLTHEFPADFKRGYLKVRVVDPPAIRLDAAIAAPEASQIQGFRYKKSSEGILEVSQSNGRWPWKGVLGSIQNQAPAAPVDRREYFQKLVEDPPKGRLAYYAGPCLADDYSFTVNAGKLQSILSAEGVTTPYWYLSGTTGTPAPLHFEDFGYLSISYVVAGAAKIWLVIPPDQRQKLEAALALDRRLSFECSQDIRHEGVLVSPSYLESHGIDYSIEVCEMGYALITMPFAYHQVANLGPNLAEAVNFKLDSLPSVPSDYIHCKSGKRCGKHPVNRACFIDALPSDSKKRTSEALGLLEEYPSTESGHSQERPRKKSTTTMARDAELIRLLDCTESHQKFVSLVVAWRTQQSFYRGIMDQTNEAVGGAESFLELFRRNEKVRGQSQLDTLLLRYSQISLARALDALDPLGQPQGLYHTIESVIIGLDETARRRFHEDAKCGRNLLELCGKIGGDRGNRDGLLCFLPTTLAAVHQLTEDAAELRSATSEANQHTINVLCEAGHAFWKLVTGSVDVRFAWEVAPVAASGNWSLESIKPASTN